MYALQIVVCACVCVKGLASNQANKIKVTFLFSYKSAVELNATCPRRNETKEITFSKNLVNWI